MIWLLNLVPRPVLLGAVVGLGATLAWQQTKLAGVTADLMEVRSANALTALLAAEQSTTLEADARKAERNAIAREQNLRVSADRARDERDGLLDAIAQLQRADPATPSGTDSARAATAETLLGQCAGEYQELARKADGHASDVTTLTQAWPTSRQLVLVPAAGARPAD